MYKRIICIREEDRSDDAVSKKVNSSLTAVVKSLVTKLLYLCDPVLLNIIIGRTPVKTGLINLHSQAANASLSFSYPIHNKSTSKKTFDSWQCLEICIYPSFVI